MKLTGTMRKGRHLPENIKKARGSSIDDVPSGKIVWWKKLWSKKILRVIAIIVGILIVLSVTAFALLKFWVGPPPIENPQPVINEPNHIDNPNSSSNYVVQTDNPTVTPTEEAPPFTRVSNKYTFIVFATDEGGGNTDVIMPVTFDAANYTLNVANIPRDTIANIDAHLKRINSIHAIYQTKFQGQDDAEKKTMDATVDEFRNVLGYKADFWFTVDMEAFVELIDAIGGVDYDVKSKLDYDDPYQDLHIHYTKGLKTGLTGKQALEIMRFRQYYNGDIGRINVQQDFLKSVIEQLFAKRSSINIIEMATIFFKHVRTNLPLNNLIWFAKEFFKMNAEDISFVTMPGNIVEKIYGQSYVSIYVDEWLEIINTMLNPFFEEIAETDVSILTRNSADKLYVTDGNWKGDPSWGSGSAASSSRASSNSSSGSNSGSGGTLAVGSDPPASPNSSEDSSNEDSSNEE